MNLFLFKCLCLNQLLKLRVASELSFQRTIQYRQINSPLQLLEKNKMAKTKKINLIG